jgi:drug/metabolite transporter (DMT)-like permease
MPIRTVLALSQRNLGILQILLSGVCFGFLGIFGKTAYQHGMTPGELLSLRFFTAGCLVLGFLLIFQRHRLLRLRRHEVLWSIALGALGYAVFSGFYFLALTGLSASLTVLLLYLYPVMVPIGAWIFLDERVPRDKWFVLPMVMMGLVLLVAGELYVNNLSAFAYGVAAAFFYSIYILCSSRFLAGADTLASAGIMQFSAGLALALLSWRSSERFISVVSDLWLLILAMAIVCSIMAMTLFLAGLQKLRNWEVSVLSTAEPATGIAIAFLLLGETLSLQQLLGASLVLGAFIALAWPRQR